MITKRQSTIRSAFSYTLLVLCALSLLSISCSKDNGNGTSEEELVIGALLSLTGNWSSLGIASKAAMEVAVEEVNAYFAGIGSDIRVRLIIEDTKLDPETALEKLRILAEDNGAMIIIGPQSSSEVSTVKNYADEKGVLIISQGSTAGALAIPGDNIFRFCPDDTHEGKAISALMWYDGVRAVIPIWRDDAGNRGLHDAVQNSFPQLGGVLFEGVKYSVDEADFSDEVDYISSQVSQAVEQYGESAVAVYLAAFDEVVGLFNEAQKHATLSSVKWYGSDGVVLSSALIGDAVASLFAVTTGYPNPIYGLDEGAKDKWQPLVEQITSETGQKPDAFALAAYDALWVTALAYHASGETDDIAIIKEFFVQRSESYDGATGSTVLNEAGDRQLGNFDFWAVCGGIGNFQWTLVGNYQAEFNEVNFTGCPQ